MRRIALFPGSFDPLTLGHLDLIERLSALYDEVVVGVMSNPAKKPYLEDEERLRSIERSVEHLANVRVALSHGATVDLARQCGAQVMVRGLRSVTDFEYETVLAAGYRYMAPDIETLFFGLRRVRSHQFLHGAGHPFRRRRRRETGTPTRDGGFGAQRRPKGEVRMNVMALLEYLDEELSKSASVPLTGKRLVDVEKCLDIVSELRVTLPDDVKDAEVIVRDREQILADAQHQAEQIIADAQQQFEQMGQ